MASKTLILGMGISGQAALKKLFRLGERHFLIVDKKKPRIDQESVDFDFLVDDASLQANDFKHVERCVLSPGVGPSSPGYQLVQRLGIPIVGEMQLGLEGLQGRKVVITGSNGKSTTVTLTAHLLSTAGLKAKAVGNIGIALSEIEHSSASDIWIVEASSYQLETLYHPAFELGVVLNITENHLDRYGNIDSYAQAKSWIQRGLLPGAELWIDSNSFEGFKKLWTWPKIYSWNTVDFLTHLTSSDLERFQLNKAIAAKQETNYKNELSHDNENVKVALAICLKLGLPLDRALEGLGSYRKLPHRLEGVGEYNGVQFINDSKSTSVAATMHALEAVQGPLVLIAGGVHKGASYSPWCQVLKERGLGVCVIGQASSIICQDLQRSCPIYPCVSLQEAVHRAFNIITSSGVTSATVLFSPGCASFDMFINYEDRGKKFVECIQELKAGGAR